MRWAVNTQSLLSCAAANLLLLFAGICMAHSSYDGDGSMLLAYRASDGSITPDSAQSAAEMRRIADRNGYITLWILPASVGLNETEAASGIQLERVCMSILSPLVSRGLISIPTNRPVSAANTCLVRAASEAITLLLRDSRVRQIMGAK